MAHYFKDGSIAPSSVMLFDKSGYWIEKFTDYGVCKARIDEVLYTDDQRNSTYNTNNKQVQYVCTILGGPNSGKKVFNVTASCSLGGTDNYEEVIRTGNTTEDNNGSQPKTPDVTHGEIVLLSFLHGSSEAPVIIGYLKHPKAPDGAKKKDGNRSTKTFNGVTTTIGPDGTIEILNSGGILSGALKVVNNLSPASLVSMAAARLRKLFDFKSHLILGADGAVSMGQALAKQAISKVGAYAFKDISGSGTKIMAGVHSTQAMVTNQVTAGVHSVKAVLTRIGLKGLPTARLGDLSIGTDSNGMPVISKVIKGSFKSMIGS